MKERKTTLSGGGNRGNRNQISGGRNQSSELERRLCMREGGEEEKEEG